mgnify:CR=1 FL=1
MKKRVLIVFLVIAILILGTIFYFNKITGKVVSQQDSKKGRSFGPSAEEQACMSSCMKCTSPGVGCTGNQQECQTSCNAKKPEQTAEESCVETCTKKGCGEFDFSCQEKNQAVCDKQCGMIKEPPAKSEEEQCIRDCVNAEQEGLICKHGEGGEKGDALCQKCAKSCENLYAGPCLTEIKLEEAKSACNTCEHCYGKPIMGDSREGYECIVSIECADASAEFGDDPGTGPGIGQEGYTEPEGITARVINFFKELFS